jgi:hypothetical protein
MDIENSYMPHIFFRMIGPMYLFLPFLFYVGSFAHATERPQIVYAGTTFGGYAFARIKTQFPFLTSEWEKGEKNENGVRLREIINQNITNAKFKFDLIDPGGINRKKDFLEVENPLSFTVLITMESLYKDEYTLKLKGVVKTIAKYYFNVGVSAIFFTPIENKDKIEYAIPVIAEDILLGPLTETQKRDQFFKTFKRAVCLLFKKIEKLNPRQLDVKIVSVSKKSFCVDSGRKAGIRKGTFVILPDNSQGIATEVKEDEAYITCEKLTVKKGDTVTINICKSEEEETCQVVDVKMTSRLAENLFIDDTGFTILCAQWFSDYLSDRQGVIVLPPKTGAAYTTSAKEALISAYDLEGNHFQFEIPRAKNEIILDITGLAKKMIKGNNINQVWIYKGWIEKDIYGKKKEVCEFLKQEVIVGVKEVNDYQIFRDVIQQTLAKLSKN